MLSCRPASAPMDAKGFHIRSFPDSDTCCAPCFDPHGRTIRSANRSPAFGARFALERTDDLVGHPSPVEPAGLRPNALLVQVRLVHASWIENQVSGERRER